MGKRKDVPLKVKSVDGDDGTVNCVLAMVRFSNGCLYGCLFSVGEQVEGFGQMQRGFVKR